MNKRTTNHILTTMSVLTLIAAIPVSSGNAAAAERARGSSHHRISVNDLVQVKVFQELELDTEARVSGDGTIRMPLIESVQVAGMTVDAAAEEISRLLLDGYLVNPQVTVNVASYSKRTFAVLGQVEDAGTYELPDNRDVTLMEAIGMAGGFSGVANRKKITLKRRSGGSVQIFEFNAKELALKHGARAVIVHEGDVITVPESIF